MKRRVQNPIGLMLALIASAWCALVLYVLISINCGVMHPLGSSLLADMIYRSLFIDPYPYSGGRPVDIPIGYAGSKLDIPIGLVHAFGLYKVGGWAIRLLKKQPS
jgi:hypothetical protein